MSLILTMNEAAAALRVSRRWLQDFLQTIPPCWLAAGNRKLFDEKAMERIRNAMRREAAYSAPVRVKKPVVRYTGPIAGSASKELAELLKTRRAEGRTRKKHLTGKS
jgi:hypothetical protein